MLGEVQASVENRTKDYGGNRDKFSQPAKTGQYNVGKSGCQARNQADSVQNHRRNQRDCAQDYGSVRIDVVESRAAVRGSKADADGFCGGMGGAKVDNAYLCGLSRRPRRDRN